MWLRTVGLTAILALALRAAPLPVDAEQPARVRRIGWLHPGPPSVRVSAVSRVFQEELRKYGWVEGQNLMIEYRFADGKVKRLSELAADLARLELDLIVTFTTPATRAAIQVIRTTPIVFRAVADPVASGFVANLARPGGNATGPSAMAPELAGKRLELLKEVVPRLSRIAVLWEPTNPGVALIFRQMQRDARKLKLALQSLEVREPDDFEVVFAAMTRESPDALVVIGSSLTTGHRARIAQFALDNQVPTIANWKGFPQSGGLMSYGAGVMDNWRRTVPYVNKILRGAKSADLPVEQPTKFELTINLKTAQALGITIPPVILFQADEVIK